jgi:hypothetical protein
VKIDVQLFQEGTSNSSIMGTTWDQVFTLTLRIDGNLVSERIGWPSWTILELFV